MYNFLYADMMMNLNMGHGSQGPYGQMMNAGGPFYGNYNMNNSAIGFYGRPDVGQRRFQQQSPQTKSKGEKKNKKAQVFIHFVCLDCCYSNDLHYKGPSH